MLLIRFFYPYLDTLLLIFNLYASVQLFIFWKVVIEEGIFLSFGIYAQELICLLALTLVQLFLWWMNFKIALDIKDRSSKEL